MQTHRLTEKLIIQELLYTSGTTFGVPVESWFNWKVVYGTILKQNGKISNKDENGNIYSDSILMYIRYLPQLYMNKKKYRIIYNECVYSIESVFNTNREATTIELVAVS